MRRGSPHAGAREASSLHLSDPNPACRTQHHTPDTNWGIGGWSAHTTLGLQVGGLLPAPTYFNHGRMFHTCCNANRKKATRETPGTGKKRWRAAHGSEGSSMCLSTSRQNSCNLVSSTAPTQAAKEGCESRDPHPGVSCSPGTPLLLEPCSEASFPELEATNNQQDGLDHQKTSTPGLLACPTPRNGVRREVSLQDGCCEVKGKEGQDSPLLPPETWQGPWLLQGGRSLCGHRPRPYHTPPPTGDTQGSQPPPAPATDATSVACFTHPV